MPGSAYAWLQCSADPAHTGGSHARRTRPTRVAPMLGGTRPTFGLGYPRRYLGRVPRCGPDRSHRGPADYNRDIHNLHRIADPPIATGTISIADPPIMRPATAPVPIAAPDHRPRRDGGCGSQ